MEAELLNMLIHSFPDIKKHLIGNLGKHIHTKLDSCHIYHIQSHTEQAQEHKPLHVPVGNVDIYRTLYDERVYKIDCYCYAHDEQNKQYFFPISEQITIETKEGIKLQYLLLLLVLSEGINRHLLPPPLKSWMRNTARCRYRNRFPALP